MSTFPPQRHLGSTPVTNQEALNLLQAYLESALQNPHLLPNTTLSNNGPTALDGTANLTLHNLKRVEAGLRGEWLAPSLELSSTTDAAHDALNADPFAVADDAADEGDKAAEAEGWQDLEEYQQEQSDIEGEIGARLPGESGVQTGKNGAEVEVSGDGGLSKEDRKAAKKARHKEEQVKKMKERQAAAAAA